MFYSLTEVRRKNSIQTHRQLHVISLLIGPKLHVPFPAIFRKQLFLDEMLKWKKKALIAIQD